MNYSNGGLFKMTLIVAFLILIIIFLIIYLPDDFSGFTVADFWGVAGCALGLGGLILSAYAAHGVSVLARQHHLKTRIPGVHDDLTKLSKKLAIASTGTIDSLKNSLVTSEIRPLMDALENLDAKYFKKRADETRWILSQLEGNFYGLGSRIANDNRNFWNLQNAISELVDVTKQYRKDMESS